ncbi:TPA_asm: TetR/AcrR family transcriptional regulator, partial [Listeria monocytogenes]|nr:TetR/AcrR family transcriptional regulator [Listeria monocytogenes]ECK9667060.1 TetR/AcrR family transcriptional regulator [Listeria monocytogenes]HAA3565141.1 TetR/AcrR family transcriptional regulator [Listeria monocytogenes]
MNNYEKRTLSKKTAIIEAAQIL